MTAMAEPEAPQMRGEVVEVLGAAAGHYSISGDRSGLFENVSLGPNQAYITPRLMSAHDEIEITRETIVRNARQLERVAPYVGAGLTKKSDMVVGARLRVSSVPDWRALGMSRAEGVKWAREWGRLAESLFHSWAYDRRKLCDGEGHDNFGGMMRMGYRNLIGPDGEVAGAIQYDDGRARQYGTRWGTFVTMIDPMRIANPPDELPGPQLVNGRRLDPWGRMIGFYVSKARAGVDPIEGIGFEYVPRETAWGRPVGFHWFQKHRGAAQRGITTMANMLRRGMMIDQFDTAQLGQAIVGAAMATFIKTDKDSKDVQEALAPEGATDVFDKLGFYQKLGLRIGGNRIPVLDRGDEIKIAAANQATADPTAFRKGFQREFAARLGISTPQYTGDYSDTNYSSERSALVDIWRGVISEQVLYCDAVPSLIYAAVIEEAVVKGWLPIPAGRAGFYDAYEAYTRCFWTGPAMGWVDPKKEAEAAQIRTDPRAPLSTLADEAAMQGRTIDELIEQRGMEQDMLIEAGLIRDPAEQAQRRDEIQSSEQDEQQERDDQAAREERE